MPLPKDAMLLRIFVGETAKVGHAPVYEALVMKARELHMAGATVLRGPMGYGHSSRVHTVRILRLSEDRPIVVEIVDSEDRISGFLPHVEEMMRGRGLVTLEKAQVVQYGPHQHGHRG